VFLTQSGSRPCDVSNDVMKSPILKIQMTISLGVGLHRMRIGWGGDLLVYIVFCCRVSILYFIVYCNMFYVYTRDDREWLFTFPFPPIPTWSIPISSHSHSQFCNQFPFPCDSHRAIPIPSHSHFHAIVQSWRHKHFWCINNSANIKYHSTELVTKSNSFY